MNANPRVSLILISGVVILGAAYLLTFRIRGAGSTTDPHTLLNAPGRIAIVRQPPPSAAFRARGPLTELPVYDAKLERGWQVDVRGRDLRALDLVNRQADLRHADFDSGTHWPAKLPVGFDPAAILELNKNPGLGVRALHARGITGRGVGLGIIDQTRLTHHVEYRDRLRSYEEIHLYGKEAQMHGPAVASIAVGRNVGVAPEADLYYIAETSGTYTGREFARDFAPLAKSIDRLVELNAQLPSDRKLRAISISVAWNPKDKGYAEVMAAVRRASDANIFVVSCAVDRTHKLAFHALGREPMSDPDRAESYGPGCWWAFAFWNQDTFPPGQKLLVPMDSRSVAGPAGERDYVFYPRGGWSWSVPWIAGLYALACQVRPTITPAEFWAEALRTGRTITLEHAGQRAEFGTIADPAALLDRLAKPGRAR